MLSYFYNIATWFKDINERYRFIREFNNESKNAFIMGHVPTLLEARITSGSSEYRHQFSKFMAGGLRIKILSGELLTRKDMKDVGVVILANETLVRKLIVMGWDTLEINDSMGDYGLRWELYKYLNIKGMLHQ
ncbi:MAG: hypothetical protein RR061_00375 [Muribaculaceae bacterium]